MRSARHSGAAPAATQVAPRRRRRLLVRGALALKLCLWGALPGAPASAAIAPPPTEAATITVAELARSPHDAWREIAAGRRRWSDAQALDEVVAFRRRWPGVFAADADALCISHALRVGHRAWQRQCWLEGLERHQWRDAGHDAVSEAIVGALLAGDARLALDYVREFTQTAARRGPAPNTVAATRAIYWLARGAQAAGHPAAAELFAQVIEAAPLSYYGLAASYRVDPDGYTAAITRDVGAMLERSSGVRREGDATSCDLLDCNDVLRTLWRRFGRVDPLWMPRTLAAELPGEFLRATFPLRHVVDINAASIDTGVPQSWMLAIGRRESRFEPHAVSSVGARGIMQMLPSTARIYRAQLSAAGVELAGSLSHPGTNLRLAAQMIAELSREHGGSLEIVASAYCSGPTRTAGWRRRFTPTDADLWVEVVPYRAVRDYMREVTAAAALYAVRMGEAPPIAGGPLTPRESTR